MCFSRGQPSLWAKIVEQTVHHLQPRGLFSVETLEAVEVPGKVSEFAQSEWEKTKEYQAESWADMKAQFVSTKNKLSGFFSNLNLD